MDKQKEILASALKLFVNNGFHGTPTSKIAKEAGVANGTLFHYYPTKDDLIVSLYVAVKSEMSAFIDSKTEAADDFQTRFQSQFIHALHWALEHPDEFQYIQQFYASPYANELQSEVLQQQLQKTCIEIQSAIDAKIIKPMPVDYIFTLISSHLSGIYQYLRKAKLSDQEQQQVISQTLNLLWNMLS